MQNELYGIYSTWHVPFWQTTWFLALVIILGLSVACFALWWFFSYKRQKPQRSAWEQALYELDNLDRVQKNELSNKEYYGRLIFIVKNYLHGRYGFDVFSRTDQELIDYLKTTQFSPELRELLQTLVNGGTMIKFANAQAAQEQMKRDLDASVAIVKQTIPTKEQH